MLTRAARRRDALRHVQAAAERIQLPWLCPVLLTPRGRKERQRRVTTSSIPRHRSPAPLPITSSRNLASAAAAVDRFDAGDDYLPFSSSSNQGRDSSSLKNRYSAALSSTMPPIDLANLLMIDNTAASPPERISTAQRYGIEISGDVNDVQTTLDACLQVHRWDRAFALLRQLGHMYRSRPQMMLDAYNRCLEAMVLDLVWNRNKTNVDKINNWVEVNMAKAGVEPDARTYALKIKVAIATLDASKRVRTVRRYWQLAQKYNISTEVAGLRAILSDNDLGKMSEMGLLSLDFELHPGEFVEPDTIEITSNHDMAKNPATEVREAPQKGLGLTSLRQSLSLFSGKAHLEELEPSIGTSSEDLRRYAEARQTRLETDAIEAAVSRWKIEHEKMAKMGLNTNFQHGRIGSLMWQWNQVMTEKIQKELVQVEKSEAKATKTARDRLRCEYGPYLRLVNPENLAALTTIGVIQSMSKTGLHRHLKLTTLVVAVGRSLEAEVEASRLNQRVASVRKQTAGKASSEARPSLEALHVSIRRRNAHHSSGLYQRRLSWSSAVHVRVGAILCELLFDSAKLTMTKEDPLTGKHLSISQPVFVREVIYQSGKKTGIVKMDPHMIDVLSTQPAGDVIAKQLPMVTEPRSWISFNEGGYLTTQQPFLRVKRGESLQRDYAEAAASRGDLDQLFAGVDVLGRTAWKINRGVFQVMMEAWNSGEEIANLPPLNKMFPEVSKPTDASGSRARFEWFRALRKIENEKSGLHSNRCFQNFQMEIAKAYLHETFYLPHNVDFRGRAYPIPPYLNQMGADNARGLLVFAKGRELGFGGLRWLKIHLANVYGYDKASLSDREDFPMKHLEEVYDSVDRPLDGKRWWLSAEDPWQCLAACIELKDALRLDDPSRFVSHMPIHQDGSCNGLQHYAALGGDIAGARQVNLEPGDKPADVYTGVAELVKAEIREEATQGNDLAKALYDRVTRKIVKQTVMTNVYGVTFLGAIRQVRKQVDDLLPDFKAREQSGTAATYIARKIFKALGTMFTGAHAIQYWLGDCANRISTSISPAQLSKLVKQAERSGSSTPTSPLKKSLPGRQSNKKPTDIIDASAFRSSVIWTTPIKLPVVQPYRVHKGRHIKTNLQDITLAEPTIADAIDKRKQLQAFPPNFVHSLDATHMILSALEADEIGLTFSAVHDSFWTHAADVNSLNSLLRDAFIRMHSEDIIGRLAAEFQTRYAGHLYLAQINSNSPLGKVLAKHRRQVGYKPGSSLDQKRHQELLKEAKRQQLIASENAKEREEGEKMVTAASLFEEYDGTQYLHAKDSLGETAIGAVPPTTSDMMIAKALDAVDVKDDVDLPSTLGPAVDAAVDAPSSVLETQATKTREKKVGAKTTWLWLPLTFRNVPKKGDFDVNVLRDSQYFFS